MTFLVANWVMGIGGTQPDRRARHSATTKVRSNVTGPGGQVARPSCTRHVLPLPIAEARLSLLPRRAGNRAFCAADARGPRGAAGQELWGHAGGNGSSEKAGRQPLPSAGPAGLWRHSPCSADENGETPGSFLSSHPCQVGVPGLGPRQPAPGVMSPFCLPSEEPLGESQQSPVSRPQGHPGLLPDGEGGGRSRACSLSLTVLSP